MPVARRPSTIRAAHTDGVVLLTAGPQLPEPTEDHLDEHDPDGTLRTTTVGGPAAASPSPSPSVEGGLGALLLAS